MIKLPTRIDLIRSLPAASSMAEIGVWRGYLSIEILNTCQNIAKLFLVDAWEKYPTYDDTINDQDMEDNYRQTLHHIRGHLPGGRVKVIRGRSLDVARDNREIPPLDALFLDSNHSYEAVLADLRAWGPRLKPTGVILCHDYFGGKKAKELRFGVVEAVDQFCKENGWKVTAVTEDDFRSCRIERLSNWTGAEL